MMLFEDDWGVDNNPIDQTEITTTMLYFSSQELRRFKKLSKLAMKKEYGKEVFDKGNLSDLLLLILSKYENI